MTDSERFILANKNRVALVINISGGKDSTQVLRYLRDRFPAVPAYCVMADTGFAGCAVDAHALLPFGVELHVVRNPNKTYLEMVRRRVRFPSAQFRQCTSDLKRGPIQKFVRQLPHRVLIHCMGIRAEESTQRAKQASWSPDLALSCSANSGRPGRTVYNWLPIFHETTQEVLQWHWQSEVPMHPVYVPEYPPMARLAVISVASRAEFASLRPTTTSVRSISTTGRHST